MVQVKEWMLNSKHGRCFVNTCHVNIICELEIPFCSIKHRVRISFFQNYFQNAGFVQKHENEIPGLFQDNSRTFFSFQGLNFIDFQ